MDDSPGEAQPSHTFSDGEAREGETKRGHQLSARRSCSSKYVTTVQREVPYYPSRTAIVMQCNKQQKLCMGPGGKENQTQHSGKGGRGWLGRYGGRGDDRVREEEKRTSRRRTWNAAGRYRLLL